MSTLSIGLLLFVFGLIIGSFLNVVITRVPVGESIVYPPSACPRCHQAIRAYDNLPVVSWLLLAGKCRDCALPISPRYPIVELATGVLFALMGWRFGLSTELPAFLFLAAAGLALAVIDLDTERLPNALTLPSYAVGGALLLIPAAGDGAWGAYFQAWLGALVLFLFYFALAWIYPAGMGLGDVKLAGVLGLYLGWLGWGSLLAGGFLGFFLGAVVGVGLMIAKRAGRKSRIPFGPFMLAGALLAILWGQQISDWYGRLFLGLA
jgi:leader peptidase (prepilin peptidase)/N-methyltransferase